MLITPYKERVLAEAARELAERTRKRPGEYLQIFAGFRKIEEHRLRLWHNAGGSGREIARQRSDLIDILFRELLENISTQNGGEAAHDPFVVAAFGGYGRRELNPFSDVDIMFVHGRNKTDPRIEEIIRQTVVALWDLGFKVGHSVRSIAQAVKQANSDPVTKTSMLECRYLTGDRDTFNEFKERFDRECVDGKEQEYVAWRLGNQAELREKYGTSVFMQEPNIKNGVGGLREYQNLFWLAYFKARISTITKLVEAKYLRESERKALEKAYDFLLRVRTEMHYQNGRAIDSLTLQLQGRVATALNYPQKHVLRRCEVFMREYYSHAQEVNRTAQAVIDRMDLEPLIEKRRILSFFTPRARTEKFDGLVARDGRLFPESRDIFNQDPFRILGAFQHAQIRQLDLSAELCELIRRRLRLIDRTFQYARVGREMFLSILSRKGEVGRILRAMHNVGFLGKYLPEFGQLTCLVQHEFFHRYTVDEHTLVCIEKLDNILRTENPRLEGYRTLFQKIEDPATLYLAILLHDTGKAANTRHHEEASALFAQKVARRLQLSSERRRMLIMLVDAHYELSHTAQSRNLDDSATVSEFASIVKNRANLDALMLLTLADGMGTSDQSWSDWKESLVWGLFRRTCTFLESGEHYLEQRQDRQERLDAASKLLSAAMAEELRAHFDLMPERYFVSFDAADIAAHVKLFHAFFTKLVDKDKSDLAPVFKWLPRPEQGHTEVWVCGWDRPGFLDRIAYAFLAGQINILSADIFTRGDSLALHIFRVADVRRNPVTSSREITRVEERLCESLERDNFDFFPAPITAPTLMRGYRVSAEADLPTRLSVDNSSHPVYTIIDIEAPDRLGLLFSLLRVISEVGLRIQSSRITTEMEVALDTFYVTTEQGEKVTDAGEIKRLQRVLHRAATGEGAMRKPS